MLSQVQSKTTLVWSEKYNKEMLDCSFKGTQIMSDVMTFVYYHSLLLHVKYEMVRPKLLYCLKHSTYYSSKLQWGERTYHV